MKFFLFLTALLIIAASAEAQKIKAKKPSYYVFDGNWNPIDLENAVYMASVLQPDDTTYEWSFYNFTGPLLSVETYKEKDRKMPHGYFAWFDKTGLIDSSGYFFDGKKDSYWYHFTDTLSVWQKELYRGGVLLEKEDSIFLKEERRKNDSIGFLPGDKEAVLKGGDDKIWIKYLQANIKLPARAEQLNKQGEVKVFFTVASDGTLKDIRVRKSVEYSLDQEALRLIQESPRWQPASQSGRPVKAYRIQPFTFVY